MVLRQEDINGLLGIGDSICIANTAADKFQAVLFFVLIAAKIWCHPMVLMPDKGIKRRKEDREEANGHGFSPGLLFYY